MGICTYRLTEHNGADIPPRYYINGIRVSRERFDDVRARAYQSGRLDSFATKCKSMPNGRFRRTNYSVATFTYPTE